MSNMNHDKSIHNDIACSNFGLDREEKWLDFFFYHECRLHDSAIALGPSKRLKINSRRYRFRSTHMPIEAPCTKIKRWCRDKITNNKTDASNELTNVNISTTCDERHNGMHKRIPPAKNYVRKCNEMEMNMKNLLE